MFVTQTIFIKIFIERNETNIMKKKFEIGDVFMTTDIFTGGQHSSIVADIQENKLICNSKYRELDGFHNVQDTYNILEDKKGEYIVLWEYHGEKAVLYACDIS